jgi:hypothetical protein
MRLGGRQIEVDIPLAACARQRQNDKEDRSPNRALNAIH